MITVQTIKFVAANQAIIVVELKKSVLVYHVRLRLNVMMVECGVVHTNVRTHHVFYRYGL